MKHFCGSLLVLIFLLACSSASEDSSNNNTTLAPPDNIQSSEMNQRLVLHWTAAPRADAYRIYQIDPNDSSSQLVNEVSTQTYANINRDATGSVLRNGQTYSFKISTVVGSLESELSEQIDAAPNTPIALSTKTGGIQSSASVCAILNSQTHCWGDNTHANLATVSSQTIFNPEPLNQPGTPWSQLSLADFHSCGITQDQQLYCWGRNQYGQLGTNQDEDNPAAIGGDWLTVAGGLYFNCGIKTGGNLWCWGNNVEGQLGLGHNDNTPTPAPVQSNQIWHQVATGQLFACGIDEEQALYCWGMNNYGQRGQSNTQSINSPEVTDDSRQWIDLSADTEHACAIDSNFDLYCWGANFYGQLGYETAANAISNVVTQVGTDKWIMVSTGPKNTCGITTGRLLYCWGDNTLGQLGGGDNLPKSTAVQVSGNNWDYVDVGGLNVCGRRDDQIYCWGDNRSASIGQGYSAFSDTVPTRVDNANDWEKVVAGYNHSCATKTNGTIWCWGEGESIGAGHEVSQTVPQQVGSLENWQDLKAGGAHNCAKQGSDLFCWGGNVFGQATADLQGNIIGQPVLSPSLIPGTWIEFELGVRNTCATKDDRSLWCWGDSELPRPFPLLHAIVQNNEQAYADHISAGNRHICFIDSVTSWCFGTNISGGSFPTTVIPNPANERFISMHSLANHICGKTLNGKLVCWGENLKGQLGNGQVKTFGTEVPQLVLGDDVTQVITATAGVSHTCASLRVPDLPSQVSRCWGDNSSGQLGTGDSIDHIDASTSPSLDYYVSLAAGETHTCGVNSNRSLWCWGANNYGQLGNGHAWKEAPQRIIFP